MFSLHFIEEKNHKYFGDDIVEITLDWTLQVQIVWKELQQPRACLLLSSCQAP